MGTWSVRINGNDAFQDIYQNFFDLYNQGQNPIDVSKKIQEDFAEMFDDYDDKNDCLFGLALAQWETKSLAPKIYNQVKSIVESGSDIEIWKENEADQKTLEKRRKELENFLIKISTEKEKPKRRVRQRFEYNEVFLLRLVAPDRKKYFEIKEVYVNGEYQNTSSMIMWVFEDGSGGGTSVFYFYTQGKFVTANWRDNQTLEIRYDKTIQFAQKVEEFRFYGDKGTIRYVAE